MADPQAMVQVVVAWDAYERIGWPEAKLFMAQAHHIRCNRTEIERRIPRFCGGAGCGGADVTYSTASAHPKCSDIDDEAARLSRWV